MSTPTIAANAYRTASDLAKQVKPEAENSEGKPDFGGMLRSAVADVVDQGRVTDVKSMDMVQGKADVVDVVTAIAETEVAMETLVSVRDRVISAYQEILRMPI